MSMIFWFGALFTLIGVGFASWFFIIREPTIPDVTPEKSSTRVVRTSLTDDEKENCKIDECEDEDIAYAREIGSSSDLQFKRLPGNLRKTLGNNNYRSAKIPSYQALKNLKLDYNIDTIINLAYDSMTDQGDATFNCGTYPKDGKTIKTKRPCEPIWARSLGLKYVYIPLTNRGPTDENWERIAEYMLEGNTLVHCRHGADRTGAVIGRFRLENQPYITKQEVLKEALKYGFKKKGINWGYGEDPFDPNRYLREWMFEGDF